MRYFIGILLILLQPLANALEAIPADDEQYIYGLGIDVDHSNAQKLALADITQKLSTRIQSSVGISQDKTGNTTTTSTKQHTMAVSQEIELPNIQVINNSKADNQWRVLVRVERKLVQLSLKQQLETINDELMFIIEDFSESQGPACWHTLSTNNHKKEKLTALIPAYLGSGMAEESTLAFSQQAQTYERLFKRCKYKNKYTITYPAQASADFKRAFEQLIKSQGFKVTNQKKDTGNIQIKLSEKQSYAFKNYLNIINAEFTVLDEFGDVISFIKLKSKGSSFNNKKEANKKAVINLIKKIETQMIKS
ncbi:hypothetical protein FGD67_05270 [Colwellia sp. M166]|uniref:LPP20 family lipoprotein n=1 Tax=Colwellia sp. M166 TaxID=2583805 RepID=UPI00211DC534|nr:LPP20 family lipoprotein [Colwellia sp. M166]UUO22657.1 hypothetical protein FGD67_05270 [Colwellia sp. M166]|tara:strand:- start:7335 stop:8258 length:924 start_codon:yes stop_codon:yes gene_type:complete